MSRLQDRPKGSACLIRISICAIWPIGRGRAVELVGVLYNAGNSNICCLSFRIGHSAFCDAFIEQSCERGQVFVVLVVGLARNNFVLLGKDRHESGSGFGIRHNDIVKELHSSGSSRPERRVKGSGKGFGNDNRNTAIKQQLHGNRIVVKDTDSVLIDKSLRCFTDNFASCGIVERDLVLTSNCISSNNILRHADWIKIINLASDHVGFASEISFRILAALWHSVKCFALKADWIAEGSNLRQCGNLLAN